MILTAKLTKFYLNSESKDGKPFLDKNDKPYMRAAIKIESDKIPADKYIYGYSFRADDSLRLWKVGDQVTINIWENDGWWNFKLPTQLDYLREDLAEAKKRIKNLEDFVLEKNMPEAEEPKAEEIEDDGESLPF